MNDRFFYNTGFMQKNVEERKRKERNDDDAAGRVGLAKRREGNGRGGR
jgi:hypothetical protein